jgi:dCTP deaminase
MILTGGKIVEAVRTGEIVLHPFDPSHVGPNSYDFRLGERCKIYRDHELDMARENPTISFTLPSEGLIVQPDRVYLVNTEEVIGSNRYVPIIRGRSSMGRMGVFIDITGDLIDLGAINQLTLQIHAVIPVRLYPGMRIGQVTFWDVLGPISLYEGKYKFLESPASSLSYRDFEVNGPLS